MQQQNHKQHAFTLMELLMVLLLISGILFASHGIYQKYLLRKDIAVVQENVEQLFNILDQSYFALSEDNQKVCSSKITNNNITPNNWKLILPSSLIPQVETPPHPNFTISCENPTSDAPAQLVIKAPLNVSADQLDWYAQRLGGAKDGINAKWQKIPTFTHAGKDPLWILSGQLENFKSELTLSSSQLVIEADNYNDGRSYYITVSYDAGEGAQLVNFWTDSYGKRITNITLPISATKINLIGITIECDNQQLATLTAPINNIPVLNNQSAISIFLSTSNSRIIPTLQINSHSSTVPFMPTSFAPCA